MRVNDNFCLITVCLILLTNFFYFLNCFKGAHPEALASVIRELRRESQALRLLEEQNQF